MLATIAKSRKQRKVNQLIFLEGQYLIEEALNAGVTVTDIFFSKIEHLEPLPLDSINTGQAASINFYKVNYDYLKIWSDVSVPSGIMGRSSGLLK